MATVEVYLPRRATGSMGPPSPAPPPSPASAPPTSPRIPAARQLRLAVEAYRRRWPTPALPPADVDGAGHLHHGCQRRDRGRPRAGRAGAARSSAGSTTAGGAACATVQHAAHGRRHRYCGPRWSATGRSTSGPAAASAWRAGRARPTPTERCSGVALPFGLITPAGMGRHVRPPVHAQIGATSEDFGRSLWRIASHAATNPAAVVLRADPSRLEEHQASRPIVDPASAPRLLSGERRRGGPWSRPA